MTVATLDLWSLLRGRPQIDPNDLADAVAAQAAEEPLDYRTRLLIRDSVDALKGYWGNQRVERWLINIPLHDRIDAICRDEFEKVGFPSISKRLMEKTDPKTVEQYLRELSRKVRQPLVLPIGGSIALIVPGLLVRHTDDVDIVDEVPKELREEHALLDELQKRYGLALTHFQRHYLPAGWSERLHYHDTYGDLQIYFVDPLDVFLSKLTSKRTKDFDDLRVLTPKFDKPAIVQRMKDGMQSAFALDELKEQAKKNWYILFGEDLPQ